MIVSTLCQPESPLGDQFADMLAPQRLYRRIVFVSAFTALKTILRLRDRVLAARDSGAALRLTLGVDMGGTSREVLEELSTWNCEVFVFHNPLPRATFHPKLYLFESATDSTLFLGSNNLTDGGLYSNYEAATRYEFRFPTDHLEYERLLRPIMSYIEPTGPTVRPLDLPLIQTLSARGVLTNETEARHNQRAGIARQPGGGATPPPNPFVAVSVPLPPLLAKPLRDVQPRVRPIDTQDEEVVTPTDLPNPTGVLVWRKMLSPSDALRVRAGSHHVGGVRLTQARFENPNGTRIDQTTYFRRLFDEFDWEPEPGGHADQERTFVPMRLIIRGNDLGIRNFEISHKPSGEAGQGNYTTILRWGRNFTNLVEDANLVGAVLSLYETSDSDAPFFMEITGP